MASKPAILEQLVQTKYTQNIRGLSGVNPLAQKNPKYVIEFIKAITHGISLGGPTINFVTADTGLTATPLIVGPSTNPAQGIIVDADFMAERIYTLVRNAVLQKYGRTAHEAWPVKDGSGLYLKAICTAIADSIQEHYKDRLTWQLTGIHPIVYFGAGVINPGGFSGLEPNIITNKIISLAPSLKGEFWPIFAKCVAQGYVEGIHQKSTSAVVIAGTCIPTPTPPQVCGIPGVGAGTGIAA